MTNKHMCTSSQTQHCSAAERLFQVLDPSNIFINEVLEHSDLLDPKLCMGSTWLQDPSNSGSRKSMNP